jgi:hypothetical protein
MQPNSTIYSNLRNIDLCVLAVCSQVQVECIYEPPQETTDTTFTLLPDSQEVSDYYCLPSTFSRAVRKVMSCQHNCEIWTSPVHRCFSVHQPCFLCLSLWQ